MQTISIPVDARPEDVQAWTLLAKAAAADSLINNAVSLAGLRGKATPSTPGHYLALLQDYQATGGFPNPFTEAEADAIDGLIKQLEDLGIHPPTSDSP